MHKEYICPQTLGLDFEPEGILCESQGALLNDNGGILDDNDWGEF
jgi:hypothetical protein